MFDKKKLAALPVLILLLVSVTLLSSCSIIGERNTDVTVVTPVTSSASGETDTDADLTEDSSPTPGDTLNTASKTKTAGSTKTADTVRPITSGPMSTTPTKSVNPLTFFPFTDFPYTDPTLTVPETTEDPPLVPDNTSGKFTSDTGTYLNLECTWHLEPIEGTRKFLFEMSVYCSSYSLYITARNNGRVIVDGVEIPYSTPDIKIDPEAGHQMTYFTTYTDVLDEEKVREGISLGATWGFYGKYSQVPIDVIRAESYVNFVNPVSETEMTENVG